VCDPGNTPGTRSNKRVRSEEDDVACGDPHIVSPDMEVVQYIPIPLTQCTPPPGLPPPPPTGKGERRTLRPKPPRPSVRGPPKPGGSRLPEGPDGLADLSSPEMVVEYIRLSDEEADAESQAEGSAASPRRRTPPLPDSDPDPGSGVGPEVGSANASVSPDARPASRDPETGGDHPEGVSVSVEGTELVMVSSRSKAEDVPVSLTEGASPLCELESSGSKAEDDPAPPHRGAPPSVRTGVLRQRGGGRPRAPHRGAPPPQHPTLCPAPTALRGGGGT